MQLGTSIRSGTLWIFAGNISRRVLEFIFSIILARLLLPSDFGILVATQVFTGVAGFIAGGGMGQALIRSKEVTPKDFHVVFTIQLTICSLIYCFFFFAAPWIAAWFDNPIYINLLRISALNFLVRPFNNIANAKLSREMRFKSTSIIGLIGFIITSSLSVTFAWYHFGVWSLVYSGLIGSLLSATCLIFYSRCYPRIAYDKNIANKLGTYGIKFSINDFIHYLRDQSPNFLISKFFDTSTLGLFNKGYSLSTYPIEIIAGSAYQTIFRALSAHQSNLDKNQYIYFKTICLVSVYTVPFYISLFWLAEPLIAFIYGEKWILSAISLQIFSIAGILRCISNPSGAVMAAHNKLGTEIKIQLITLLLAVIGVLWGIQKNELLYITLGIIPSYVFFASTMSYFALKALNASFGNLLTALSPALILNSSLALIIYLADKSYVNFISPEYKSSFTYLSFIGSIGFLTYSSLFLYMPLASLNSEAQRWKVRFRLPTNEKT